MKVLKITAVWCPACIIMNSRWEKIKAELPWVEVEDYDYDVDGHIVTNYNIGKDIPIFIFLDNEGREYMRLQGEIDRRELMRILEENREK